MKVIDVHTHMFSDQVVNDRNAYFRDPAFRLLYENPGSRIIGYDALLNSMDVYNVERSICLSFSWDDPGDCERENEYLARSSEHSGGRIVPFGMVSGRDKDPGARVKELAEIGFKGVGEISFYNDGMTHAKEDYLSSVFRGCSENNMIVMLHVNEPIGRKYPGKACTDFDFLVRLISENQGLKIICAHWGGGLFALELIKGIGEVCADIYYDCAAGPYVYDRRIYSTAVAAVGSGRILFGSDYPLIPPDKYYGEMDGLSEEIKRRILYENAGKLIDEAGR